jgi:hypothetical protein
MRMSKESAGMCMYTVIGNLEGTVRFEDGYEEDYDCHDLVQFESDISLALIDHPIDLTKDLEGWTIIDLITKITVDIDFSSGKAITKAAIIMRREPSEAEKFEILDFLDWDYDNIPGCYAPSEISASKWRSAEMCNEDIIDELDDVKLSLNFNPPHNHMRFWQENKSRCKKEGEIDNDLHEQV